MRSAFSHVAVLVALGSACVTGGSTNRAPQADRTVITREQLLEHHFTNAFEAVQALRSNWLETKGADSFSTPTQVLVYLDDTRLGGIETLRSIATATIVFIRHFDGISAAARWGLDHGQGVIFVSTRS
jgi:hypothetical protein